MSKLVEQFFYSFGLNLSFYRVSTELELLDRELPAGFRRRRVTDVGCGDGGVTRKLERVLAPRSLRGVDVSESLVRSARRKGIAAEVADVERTALDGDLGVLWGVLHHFERPVPTLARLRRGFDNLIVRESVDDKRLFEFGHRFNRETFLDTLAQAGIERGAVRTIESPSTRALIVCV